MTDSFSDFVDSLANDPIPTRKNQVNQLYPCGQCAGTGMYQGVRLHQPEEKCFACRGTGHFAKSPSDRAASKLRRELRKAKAQHEAVNSFTDQHPGLMEFLTGATWSGFAQEMAEKIKAGNHLSEGQTRACYSMLAKQQARDEQRAAEKVATQVIVDLAPIRAMFEAAVASGHKKPKYRAEGLVINRAPEAGLNPGALYIKDEAGTYLGKILGTTYSPSREGKEALVADTLTTIAINPLEAAIRYGQRTGKCACCGRKLTKGESIDLGIGPVCRETWGL